MMITLAWQDLRPSGAVLLPGCSVKELAERPGERTGGHCLLISRPDGGSCIWLLADNTPEFNEWKEMLEIAANKQRSRVGCHGGDVGVLISNLPRTISGWRLPDSAA